MRGAPATPTEPRPRTPTALSSPALPGPPTVLDALAPDDSHGNTPALDFRNKNVFSAGSLIAVERVQKVPWKDLEMDA